MHNSFLLQDTVVALQALALYSERTAGKSLDLRVKLESEDGKWKPAEIHITPENALLRRQYDVSYRHRTNDLSTDLSKTDNE